MIILHPHVPTERPEQQAGCWAALELLRDRWDVHDIEIDPQEDAGYARALRERWRDGQDWLIVEHDVVVSAELVMQLESCHELLCSALYPGFPVPTIPPLWVTLGCTKITARARGACDPPGETHWRTLDGEMTAWLAHANRCSWHLHTTLRPRHDH